MSTLHESAEALGVSTDEVLRRQSAGLKTSFDELRVTALRVKAERDELLALAKQYASECGNCKGTGVVTVTIGGDGYGDRCTGLMDSEGPCPDCADIRRIIARAEGSP